jgi:poly(hydroxyalkanoate) granule-associated protein
MKGKAMTRTTRKAKVAAKPAAPAAAFRKFTASARKALEAGLVGTRELAVGKAVQARKAALAQAGAARTKTLDAVTRLERVFEQRVSSAIAKLGVPTSRDVRALSHQIARLQASVEQLKRARSRA